MESDPEIRPRPRRWLRWLSIIGLLMAVVVWLYFRDEALEAADDLLPQRPSVAGVPDEENGWVQWQKVCDSLPEISKEEQKRLRQVISLELPAHPERDGEFALSDEALAKLEFALKLPVWGNVAWQTAMEMPRSSTMLSVGPRLDARLLQSIQLRQHDDILRIVESAAALRRRTAAGGTSEQDFAMGAFPPSRVPWLLVQLDFSDKELASIAEALSADPFTLEDLAEMMRHEYRMARNILLQLPAAELTSAKGILSDYSFNRHATANLSARICRANIRATLEGHFRPNIVLEAETPGSGWVSRLRPNSGGRALAISLTPGLYETLALTRISAHRCERVLVALHRYWKARGALPDDLNALVPQYLPELPADPYNTQQPLRWDKAKRIVYSIGKRKSAAVPDFGDKGQPSAAGWFKMVAPGGLGVRFRRPEEGPDVPVK